MARIAFSIKGAARTAAVTEEIIVAAVKNRDLIARRIEGKRIVILASDIAAWLKAKPSYF